MLAPSAATVRRPSSAADMILSRSESLLVASPGDHYRSHLSPSGSVHSAPLTASPSACWAGAPCGSLEFSRSSTPSVGSPNTSPEARKRYWYRRLTKLKDEMDRVGDGLRRSFRGSFDTLAMRLSPSLRRRSRTTDNGSVVVKQLLSGNGINVEIVRKVRRPRSKSGERSRSSGAAVQRSEHLSKHGVDGAPVSDFTLPSTLLLTGLRDGTFSGEIPLDSAVSSRSLTVRIRDYRLEFYVPGEMDTVERSTVPHFIGAVSLPIYIDTASLLFRLKSPDLHGGEHRLLIDGRLKGCSAAVITAADRRLSVSATDLRQTASCPP